MAFDPVMIQTVENAAQAAGVPAAFALGVAQQESGFNPTAISPVGALGLMQVLPATADWMLGRPNGTTKADELLNPTFNALVGTKFLAWLLKRYNGDTARAAAAYNWGPGHVSATKNWDDVDASLPAQTHSYWRKVLNYAAAWEGKISQAEAAVENKVEDVKSAASEAVLDLGFDGTNPQRGAINAGLLIAAGILLVLWWAARR
jgi:hypothetical protein